VSIVMARYFRYMDTKRWDEFRGIFTDDVTMSAPDDVPGKAPTQGADRVVERVSTVLADAVSVHHGHMPEIEIESSEHARGIWAMSDVVTFPDDPTRNFRGSGHYHAEFRNTADGWKISSLTLRRLSLEQPHRA
jgi:hypothetical protein